MVGDLDNVFICDIETDGLLEEATKLHVFSAAYKSGDSYDIKCTRDEKDIKKVFGNKNNTVVGHNFFLFDVPLLEKLFNIKVEATIIDSLFLSWYLEPDRLKSGKKHGLESWGEELGTKKTEIGDDEWKNLSYEKAKERVISDVKINSNLWIKQLNKLFKFYNNDSKKVKSFLSFLMTKGRLYKMQQDNPLLLDIKQAKLNKQELEEMIEAKVIVLSRAMPMVKKTAKKTRPKKCYKKDGTPSAIGERWFKLMEEKGLPSDYDGEVEYVVNTEKPNPQSTKQVKDWLFLLGWEPDRYIESVLKSGEVNKVPQVKDKDKNLCKSVLKLAEKEPAIKELSNLGVLQHRLGIVKGFLRDCDEDGNIVAGIAGLTNTLRSRHKFLVNMPKPSAPYGKYIRSLIKPQKGKIMIGADLSGLENTTRNNFIYPYDPEYVEEMSGEYYDSHLDIGIVAQMITPSESLFYKWWKEKKDNPNIKPEEIQEKSEDYKFIENAYKTDEQKQELFDDIDKKRAQAKTVNYSALYNVGATKLSKELKIKKREAKNLLDAFWKKNKSVKQFANDCKIVKIEGQEWVINPLNGYLYNIRKQADIFSTVNQGTGDYIFTMWCHYLMELGIKVQGNFHDEIITTCLPKEKEETIKKIKLSLDKVNKALGLKIPIKLDYEVGESYSDVH